MPAKNVKVTLEYYTYHSITVSNEGHDSTTVTIKNSNGNEIDEAIDGTLVSVYVNNSSNTEFVTGVLYNGNMMTYSNGKYTFEMPNADVVITLQYGNHNNISVSSSVHQDTSVVIEDSEGNEITSALENEEVYVTVTTTNDTEIITGVTYNGTNITSVTGNTYMFLMPATSVEISVTYQNIYSISLSDAIHETTAVTVADKDGNPITSSLAGNEVVLTVNNSSTIEDIGAVTYNGTAILENGGVYKFTMPEENVVISVDYDYLHTINLSSGIHTDTTVKIKDKDGNAITSSMKNEEVTLEVSTKNECEVISAVKYNGTTITPSDGKYTFIMPNEDVTITVEYEDLYLLSTSDIHSGTKVQFKDSDGNTITRVKKGTTVYVEASTTSTTEIISKVKYNNSTLTLKDGKYSFTMPSNNVVVTIDYESLYSISLNRSIHSTTSISIKDSSGKAITNSLANKTITLEVSDTSTTELIKAVKMNGTELSKNSSGNYTFTMPSKNAEITVEYETLYTITKSSEIHSDTTLTITDKNGNALTNATAGTEVNVVATTTSSVDVIKSVKYNGVAATLTDNKYKFTMPSENVTITVEYESPYTLEVSSSIHSGTTVLITDDEGDIITNAFAGSNVNLEVSTTSYSEIIKSVKYNDTVITPVDGVYSFVMPNENVTITVEYESLYTLEVSSTVHSGTNVNITNKDGGNLMNALAGTEIHVEVSTTSTSETIKGVKYNGIDATLDNGIYKFTMPSENVVITVDYETKYTLTVDPSVLSETTIKFRDENDNEITSAYAGTTVNVDVTNFSDEYVTKAIKVNGTTIEKDSLNKYSFTMPSENVVITVEYDRLYNLTVGEVHATDSTVRIEDAAGEEISKAKVGDEIYVNATTTSTTETIGGISHDGIKVTTAETDGRYKFTMLQGDCTIDIIYKNEIVDTYQNCVVYGSDSNGSINWQDPEASANYGDIMYIWFNSKVVSNVKVNNVECTEYNIDQGSGVVLKVYKFTMPNTVATITYDIVS